MGTCAGMLTETITLVANKAKRKVQEQKGCKRNFRVKKISIYVQENKANCTKIPIMDKYLLPICCDFPWAIFAFTTIKLSLPISLHFKLNRLQN